MSEEGMGLTSSKVPPGIAITLDALGTLYRFREPVAIQYLSVARRCGLKEHVDTKSLSDAFRVSYKSLNSELPNYGKGQLSNPRAWWKTLVNDAFRQVVKESEIPDHLGESLYDHFSSGEAYELYPDVKPFFASIRELKDQWSRPEDPPITVGVVSNSDPRVKQVLQSLGIQVGLEHVASASEKVAIMARAAKSVRRPNDEIDPTLHQILKDSSSLNDINFLITSYYAGSEKPDRSIFHQAILAAQDCMINMDMLAELRYKHGVDRDTPPPPLRSLPSALSLTKQAATMTKIHIGDDYEKDYEGAKRAGWEALYLVRDGEGSAVEGANTVRSLEEAALMLQVMINDNFSKREP